MLEVLCPSEVTSSVSDINLAALRERGIRALVIDLDNTLMGWDDTDISPAMQEWVHAARSQGFLVCIASNGLDDRVNRVAELLGVPAIAKATKPRKRPFRRALEILQASPDEAAVIGDQIFTDILGGNRMDLYTILINPISRKEFYTTQIVRHVEKHVLARLHKKGLLKEDALKLRQKEPPAD